MGSYLGFGCWAGLRGSALLYPETPRPGEDRSDPGEALCPHTEVVPGRVPRAAVTGPRSSSSSHSTMPRSSFGPSTLCRILSLSSPFNTFPRTTFLTP